MAGEFKVSNQLGCVDGGQSLDGFVFDDDGFFNKPIYAITCINFYSIIHNG